MPSRPSRHTAVLVPWLVLLVFTATTAARDIVITSKALDDFAYDNWGSLSIRDRLPYLLDGIQLIEFESEYVTAAPEKGEITLDSLTEKLNEFQSEKGIIHFFKECDADRSQTIDYPEYIECRGYYDINGNPNEISDFDVIENVILEDYRLVRDTLLAAQLDEELELIEDD